MLPTLIYTVIACTGDFAMNFDLNTSKLLIGNKSYTQTERCEIRYDDKQHWSQGYIETNIHSENVVCGDFVDTCYNEYTEETKAKIFVEIDNCNIDNIRINSSYANRLYFNPDQIKQQVRDTFKYQIDLAKKQFPNYQVACQN